MGELRLTVADVDRALAQAGAGAPRPGTGPIGRRRDLHRALCRARQHSLRSAAACSARAVYEQLARQLKPGQQAVLIAGRGRLFVEGLGLRPRRHLRPDRADPGRGDDPLSRPQPPPADRPSLPKARPTSRRSGCSPCPSDATLRPDPALAPAAPGPAPGARHGQGLPDLRSRLQPARQIPQARCRRPPVAPRCPRTTCLRSARRASPTTAPGRCCWSGSGAGACSTSACCCRPRCC